MLGIPVYGSISHEIWNFPIIWNITVNWYPQHHPTPSFVVSEISPWGPPSAFADLKVNGQPKITVIFTNIFGKMYSKDFKAILKLIVFPYIQVVVVNLLSRNWRCQSAKSPITRSSSLVTWSVDGNQLIAGAFPKDIPNIHLWYCGWLRNPAPVENSGKHPMIQRVSTIDVPNSHWLVD